MNTNVVQPQGKRKYRNMRPETKEKLSQANKGKKHSEITKQRISKSMENYWKNLSYLPTDNNNNGNNTIYNGQ